jgi:Holliday junction resolvasome RuvABC endonuclease subunit
MSQIIHSALILAVYPNVNGLGYAVFEKHLRPVDWGMKTARKRKHVTMMRHATWLIHLFKPAMIILPVRSTVMAGSQRLQKIAAEIEKLATSCGMTVHWYSRSDIKAAFAQYGAESKDAIARAIARLLPEFEQHVPPVRKIWMSEDYRMGLFDAVALAMTFYQDAETNGERW